MRTRLSFLAVLILGLAASPARAAHTQARLVLALDSAKPGDTVLAGVHLHMDPHWHTYWVNNGEAGKATEIAWRLPAGITAGEIQWPVPGKLPPLDITTYGYENDVVLLVPLKIAPDAKPGPLELNAKVSWLECEESCVPGSAEVSITLNVGAEARPSPDAELIRTWQTKLPRPGVRATWEAPEKPDLRPVILEWTPNPPVVESEADFYPLASDAFEVLGATTRLPADGNTIRLRKLVKKFQGDWPKEIAGLLIQGSGESRLAVSVTVPIAAESQTPVSKATATPAAAGKTTAEPVVKATAGSLWKNLLLGFLGGIILNVMPCVFPVIALKILGFVQQSRHSPRRIFEHGLIYSLGVIVSFLCFAAAVIAIQRAGGAASWGMQLQNRWFTLALTVITLLVALNLFGLFEVSLSGRVMDTAGQLASREGMAGSFFNGMFATLLATPCTAPILANALGYAFAQPPAVIVVMFLAVGLGLAFPYIILSWRPQWLKFLPRPGAWMEKFKVAMGFPMLATMIWLYSFNARRFGTGGALRLGLFLVIVAMAAWIWGQLVQRGTRGRLVAMLSSLALIGLAIGVVSMRDASDAGWGKWSPQAVAEARAQGRPVLVDFTADWCVTCKANKLVAIDAAEVQKKLKEINAVMLIGDNTDEDPAIVTELKKFERAGVPLVLVYPQKSTEPPMVLPALLTPGIMLDYLKRAVE